MLPITLLAPCSVLLAAALLSAPAAQDDTPAKPAPPSLKAADEPTVFLASDGRPAESGRIPEDTPADALERWETLKNGRRVNGQSPAPIRSLVLSFDAELRERADKIRKDTELVIEYLEEGRGLLKTTFVGSKRISARGPDGDWMIVDGELVDLGGRGDETSRIDHERWLAMTRNFCTISDAANARIVRIAALDVTPFHEGAPLERVKLGTQVLIDLPTPELGSLARKLTWLEVDSPDFVIQDVVETDLGKPRGVVRARLGLDPKTNRIVFAQIVPLGKGKPVETRSALSYVPQWTKAVDQIWIPENLMVYRMLPQEGRILYDIAPTVDLFVRKSESRINPRLEPSKFLPPK